MLLCNVSIILKVALVLGLSLWLPFKLSTRTILQLLLFPALDLLFHSTLMHIHFDYVIVCF